MRREREREREGRRGMGKRERGLGEELVGDNREETREQGKGMIWCFLVCLIWFPSIYLFSFFFFA